MHRASQDDPPYQIKSDKTAPRRPAQGVGPAPRHLTPFARSRSLTNLSGWRASAAYDSPMNASRPTGRGTLLGGRIFAAAVISVMALSLSDCAGEDTNSHTSVETDRPTYSPPETEFDDVTEGGIDDGDDGTVSLALEEAGYTAADVRAVAVVGRETGYMWRSRPATTEEQATFAYSVYLECVDVASGEKTWDDSRSEAILTGATASEAATMTTYLEQTFCPIGAADVEASEPESADAGRTDTSDGSVDTEPEETTEADDWSLDDEPEESTSSPTQAAGALHTAAFKNAITACPKVDYEFLEVEDGYPLVYELLLLKEPRPQSDSDDLVYGAYVAQECFMTSLGLPASLRKRVSKEDEGEGSWTSANGAKWALTWIYDGTVVYVTYDAKEKAYW